MKVIDLLNKIAKGEEVPKKIKLDNKIYSFSETYEQYHREEFGTNLLETISDYNYSGLNDEVEIIEEDKKIKKLDVALLGQCDNWLQKRDVNIKSDFELNPYIIENIRENTLYFQRKINEIIDEVNKLKENK